MITRSSKKAYYIKLLLGSALAIHLSVFVIKPWVTSKKNQVEVPDPKPQS